MRAHEAIEVMMDRDAKRSDLVTAIQTVYAMETAILMARAALAPYATPEHPDDSGQRKRERALALSIMRELEGMS